MTEQGRSGKPLVTCGEGHVNSRGQYFCGECGDQLEPDAVFCLAGHANPDGRRFCGDCGVPLVAPPGVEASATARWSVDPTGRHQCRYWDGANWTRHVADNGALGDDRAPTTSGGRAETWIAVVVGIVTVGLLAAAGADIWVQLARDAAKPPAAATSSTATTAAESSSATETAPPPPAAPPGPPSPAVVAAACPPGGGNGVAADGSVTYCERLADTDRYMWSLNPGDIPTPDVGQGGDPAVGVCMVQTGRTEADCVEYLQPAQ